MERIFAIMVLVCLFATSAFAAGSWTILDNDEGYLDSSLGGVMGLPREATTDASAGTTPDWPYSGDSALENISGCMTGYTIQFPHTDYADSVVVVLKDKYGGILNPDYDEVSNTGSADAVVRVKLTTPECFAGGLYGTFTTTGNSKTFKIIPWFLR